MFSHNGLVADTHN